MDVKKYWQTCIVFCYWHISLVLFHFLVQKYHLQILLFAKMFSNYLFWTLWLQILCAQPASEVLTKKRLEKIRDKERHVNECGNNEKINDKK